MKRILHILALPLICATSVSAVADKPATRGLSEAPFEVERTGALSGSALREVSGMAVSRRDDSVIWVHNDSGSRAHVYAIAPSGKLRGRVTLKGATASDWEDMAAFEHDGEPMLVVADVGDNSSQKSNLWLHFFREPQMDEFGDKKEIEVEVDWSVPFHFPEDPADCEAIAVDVQSARVLLLTKRQNPPRLYALPIKPEGALPLRGKRVDAQLLGTLSTIPRPTVEDLLADPMLGPYSSQPTAMDVSGNELLVLTYRHGYLFARAADGAWSDALAEPPSIVLLPRMKQSESVAFDRHGRDAFVTSERRNSPVYRLRRTGQIDSVLTKKAVP